MTTHRIASLAVAPLVLGACIVAAEDQRHDPHRASAVLVQPGRAPDRNESENLRRVLPSPHGRGLNSATRAADHDGIPNRLDSDDDGNGIRDDLE